MLSKLIASADIVITNIRGAALGKLGLEYEQVKQAKAEQALSALQQLQDGPQTPAEQVVAKVAEAKQEVTEADLDAFIENQANEKIAAMQQQLTPEQQLEGLVDQRVEEKLAFGKGILEGGKKLLGRAAQSTGRATTEGLGRVGKGGFKGSGKLISPEEAKVIGGKVLGGGAGALAGGGIAAGMA